jgi:hypothetical protein
VTFTATNGVGIPATQSFTLTVGTASSTPIFTSAQSAAFTVGGAGIFTITTSATPADGDHPAGTLPTGVAFTDNGNGTATLTVRRRGTGGAYPITFTATNGTPVTQNFVLTVQQSASITSAPAATFSVGLFSTFTVTTAGLPARRRCWRRARCRARQLRDNGDGTATLSGIPVAVRAVFIRLRSPPSTGSVRPARRALRSPSVRRLVSRALPPRRRHRCAERIHRHHQRRLERHVRRQR